MIYYDILMFLSELFDDLISKISILVTF